MRKAQKQQAEDFIKILGEAHDEIRKAIEKKNISAALSLLADCQDGAIALGNLIEAAEGEGFATIALLESYCEQVYRIYGELEKGQPIAVGKVYKSLRQMFFKIESSVKNDIRIRTEVVFLPYKASMWDSLESIWKAADEDPDCDAYVIPIPYYDKNPDGSFRELHYEGGEYPKDVPVVWYEDYDFETRRPDMVYIHNPYDDCNIVTSVHPFFYSKNLKKFTDKLVYVPYFILGEVDPENRQELEGIEKFCLVPGVAYADQVIVQSEDMRQAYVNVLTEFMSGQGRSRAYWEKKILGLGSPKVDKVLSTRKEDLEIPEEWMKVIRKADGSWKKVIFYNTTVTALLQYNGQYLEKMRDVFRVFYEKRDEVALLWRPHPLFRATIESMRLELEAEYKEIVENYRRDGWGIYDDTADMDRAICLSDAYYGDESSVLNLYKLCGKDYIIQNSFVINKRDGVGLWEQDFVVIEKKLWFVSRFYNKLLCYDLSSGKIIQEYNLPVQNKYAAFYAIQKWKNKLILLPFNDSKLVIFDMLTTNIECVPLAVDTSGICFFAREIYEDNLFMFARSNNRADFNRMLYYQIDLKSFAQKWVMDELDERDELDESGDIKRLFHVQSARAGENAYFVKSNENKVLNINLRTGHYEWIKIRFDKQIVTINLINERLYLITYNCDVIVYNVKTQCIKVIENKMIFSEKYFELEICSYNSLVSNSKIILFFGNMRSIFEFDIETEEINLSNLNNNLMQSGKKYESVFRGIVDCYSIVKRVRDEIYLWNLHNCTFVSIDLANYFVSCQRIPEEYHPDDENYYFSKRKSWREYNLIQENTISFLDLHTLL